MSDEEKFSPEDWGLTAEGESAEGEPASEEENPAGEGNPAEDAAVKAEEEGVASSEGEAEEPLKGNGSKGENMDFILDISLDLAVELGKTTMMIKDLLQLGQGSVVELSKQVGEPVDIHVNNKLIARGEVVSVDDRYGVRLTDIISPSERIRKLG